MITDCLSYFSYLLNSSSLVAVVEVVSIERVWEDRTLMIFLTGSVLVAIGISKLNSDLGPRDRKQYEPLL